MTAHAPAPQVAHFTLKNGLEVVVIPDHRAPVVTHMVWYRNGAADDPPGKSGIAHFLEHLMFKGTAAHPKGEFSEFVAAIGGQENAFTGPDFTAYFQQVAKEHLKACMEFEADRMTGLVLTDDDRRARARRGARGAAHALRHRPGRAARRSGAGDALHPSPLRRADHRLGPRDRGPRARGRARLLPALLHARERHPDRRRRRRPGGDAEARRGDLRQGRAARRAARGASARWSRRPSPTGSSRSRDEKVAAAELAAPLSRARPAAPRPPANRRRSTCSATCSAAARRACSIASW